MKKMKHPLCNFRLSIIMVVAWGSRSRCSRFVHCICNGQIKLFL